MKRGCHAFGSDRCRLAHAAGFVLLIAATLLSTGCPPDGHPPIHETKPPAHPRDLDQIVSTIQDNAAKLDRALYSGAIHVVARLVDAKKHEHAYTLDGMLLYKKPRFLLINLTHGLGMPVMQIGSNDDEYWVWIEPEMPGMWWGKFKYAGSPCVMPFTVRADQVAGALGIGGLPDASEGLVGPLRAWGKERDILYYAESADDGSMHFVRQYYVDRSPPFQIRLIAFLDDYGRKTMSALLDDYRPAWPNGPLIPHQVSIFWPEDGGRFTILIDRTSSKSDEEISAQAFKRPEGNQLKASVRENISQIDEDCEKSGGDGEFTPFTLPGSEPAQKNITSAPSMP